MFQYEVTLISNYICYKKLKHIILWSLIVKQIKKNSFIIVCTRYYY